MRTQFVQMSHLFNTYPYIQFSLNNHGVLKKQLESRIEAATDAIGDDLHSIEVQEQTLIDQNTCMLYHEGEHVALPAKLLEHDYFGSIFSTQHILNLFTEQEKQRLTKYLPSTGDSSRDTLALLFTIKQLNGLTPLENFERQLKKGHFTLSRQKQDEIIEQLSLVKLKQIYVGIYNTVKERLQEKKNPLQRFTYKNEDSELDSLQDLEERAQVSDNSEATESQEDNNYEQFEEYPNQILYRYDYSKQKLQEELLVVSEDRGGDKKTAALKNIITVKPRNNEWVENFRKQEFQRYSNPTRPWIYICEDGRKVTVAPVAKKLSVLTGKPRFHAMLKNQRPACVTILTLARDAAARLPNGVGTRADICELVKESQYINQDLPEQKLSSTISGALDRLHYMPDACVKYDSEKKLWIYLHIDRSHEHPGWGDDGEQYTEKNSAKKKKPAY